MGDKKQTREFKVLPDPRVIADGVTLTDMQEQYELSCQLRDLMMEARMFQTDLQKSMRVWAERLATGKRLTGREKGSYEKFIGLYRKVITETGIAYPQPMLIDQISYLNSQLGSADQKPGKDLYIRYEQLKLELAQAKNDYHAMK
jgi:hypothetical protein